VSRPQTQTEDDLGRSFNITLAGVRYRPRFMTGNATPPDEPASPLQVMTRTSAAATGRLDENLDLVNVAEPGGYPRAAGLDLGVS
jgi:hypothetical protein